MIRKYSHIAFLQMLSMFLYDVGFNDTKEFCDDLYANLTMIVINGEKHPSSLRELNQN